jgi:pseudaminic acid cytidylyltransferase
MHVAIIPARGGSKRIPRKNIKEFCGKPMIVWAIEAAKKSGLFEQIIVSTDDEEISELANAWGAKTPFKRPADLADDLTPTVPVIAHATKECLRLGMSLDYVCCIYPCAPFIEANDLVVALDLAVKNKADFVYPVAEYAHPIQRAMKMSITGKMEFISPQYELTRTQDLEKSFHDAGQFYWGNPMAWMAGKKMHTAGLGMKIPNWRVVDIDSMEDWERAELVFKALYSGIEK